MKLYYSPGACSLSPHIALREAGLEFELERVEFSTKKTSSGADYLTINPKGYVPALDLGGGELLTEGPAIVQFVADQKPESGLAPPAGTLERVRLQEWLAFISTEIHKAFSLLFDSKTPEEYKAQVREKLGKRLDYVQSKLDGRDFLMGERFTVADAYLFTVLLWTKYTGVNLDTWPALVAYVAKIKARPTVKAAFAAERPQQQA